MSFQYLSPVDPHVVEILPRTSASRYFWWLAFVDQPELSSTGFYAVRMVLFLLKACLNVPEWYALLKWNCKVRQLLTRFQEQDRLRTQVLIFCHNRLIDVPSEEN